MVRIGIAGVGGRMGQMLVHAIAEHPSFVVRGGLEHSESPHIGEDIGVVAALPPLDIRISSDVAEAFDDVEVVIDFSSPQGTAAVARYCADRDIAIVVGTTGLEREHDAVLKEAARTIPILVSPNMSVGVNVSFKLIEMATRALGSDVDIEVEEIHHKHKVDAPSGTAVRIGEIIAEARDSTLDDTALYGREGITGERVDGSIGFHSLRGGDVVGEHTVVFAGTGERIEITHRAGSRMNFAAGAMRATEFVLSEKAKGRTGILSMDEVLGLV